MTIINPNSISGISSITALNSTAAINLFKADGTSANVIAGVATASTLRLPDNTSGSVGRLQIGNGLDLSLFHDGTNSFLVNNSGYLSIQSQDGVNGIFIARNAEVNLYYGSNVRMQTSSAGITVNRDLDVDGQTHLDNVSIAGVTTASDNISIVKSSGPILELTTNTNAADSSLRLHEGTAGSTSNGGGMYYSGANNKLYITCGTTLTTERITIDRDTGNVGINSTIPSQKLDVMDGTIHVHPAGKTGLALNGIAGQDVGVVRWSTGSNDHAIIIRGSSNDDGSTITAGNTMEFREYGSFSFKTGNNSGTMAERLRITPGGDISINNAATPPSSNGQVGKRFGIKSTQNNVIIGETTSSGNVGLMLESRVTGRSGGARSSQIELANGVMRFYTAASGADVTERLRITSTGVVQFKDNQGTYTNTVHSHSGEAGFITHYTARTTYGGADLYRRMLDIASGGANPHGSSIRFLTSDNNSNPATCIERMRIMDGGGVFIGTKTHTQRYSHAESPALLTVQNGARVTTSSSTYAAPKGGFCDYARYELEQKLISFSTSNVQLTQARNGQPLTINNSRDAWAHYSNLPNYLLGHAATDNINNTNFTLTLYANMTVFLLRTNGWNSVDLTNWNLIESDTQIGPASSDTRLYVKSLAAGTYTNFDNDSAMYFFVL